jgi:hypothetical protein
MHEVTGESAVCNALKLIQNALKLIQIGVNPENWTGRVRWIGPGGPAWRKVGYGTASEVQPGIQTAGGPELSGAADGSARI